MHVHALYACEASATCASIFARPAALDAFTITSDCPARYWHPALARYAMLFGSEAFDDLIGELQLTSMMQQAEESGAAGNMDP